MSNVAEAEAKAQEDGATHAFDHHGLLASDAITFDILTEAGRLKIERGHAVAEAKLLATTPEKLAKMRAAAPMFVRETEEPSEELVAARIKIAELEQELAAAQQRANRKGVKP